MGLRARIGKAFWIVAAVCLLAPSLAFGDAVVRDVRFGVHSGYTRFVVEIDGSARPRNFTLGPEGGDSYRVVLDLPPLDWSRAGEGERTGKGLVARMRTGRLDDGSSRIVLDLPQPAAVKTMMVLPPGGGNGTRVVVDLVRTDAASFLGAAGAPPPAGERPRSPVKEAERPDPAPARIAAVPIPSPRPELGVTTSLPSAVPVPTPAPPAPEPAQRATGLRVIVIDPGHGGKDPGAVSSSGVEEKEVVAKVAEAAKNALEATGRYAVYLTRTDDSFVDLKERVRFAREKSADLFISLHADTLSGGGARGASVYTLSEKASDREAERLAKKENAADIIPGIDFGSESQDVIAILVDLTQRDTKNNSVRFAKALAPEFVSHNVKMLKNTHRYGPFRVLTAPDIPSVLVELGFLSDSSDEHNLQDAAWRGRVADAVASAVDSYFAARTAFALPVD